MEPEGPLPCSQKPATGPYPEPDAFSSLLPIEDNNIVEEGGAIACNTPKQAAWPCRRNGWRQVTERNMEL